MTEGHSHQVVHQAHFQAVSRLEHLPVHAEGDYLPWFNSHFYLFGPVVLALGLEDMGPERNALDDIAHGEHAALEESHIQEAIVHLGEGGHAVTQGILTH